MIGGGGLIRFYPYQQKGEGLPFDWKDLKKRAPVIARDVLTVSLTQGLKQCKKRCVWQPRRKKKEKIFGI